VTVKREQVLIEALPYIREFYDSIMVFKIGGSIMSDRAVLEDFIRDVVLLRYIGIHPIIVHGGGPEISQAMEKFGKKAEFVGAFASPIKRRWASRAWSCWATSMPSWSIS